MTMNSFRFSVALVTAAATLGLAFGATAQTPPAAPAVQGLPKVVGTSQHPRLIPSMFVLNARGAKLQDKKLVSRAWRRASSCSPTARCARPATRCCRTCSRNGR